MRIEKRQMVVLLALPFAAILWAIFQWIVARVMVSAGFNPTFWVAVIGWGCMAYVAGSWAFARPDSWFANCRIRSVVGWFALTGVIGHLTAKTIMRGWDAGVSLSTWMVLAVSIGVACFVALAANRGIALCDRDYCRSLEEDQELDWRHLNPTQVDRLYHDMIMGKWQAVVVDLAISLAIAAALIVGLNGPLGTLHNDWVASPPPVVTPAEAPEQRTLDTSGGFYVNPGEGGKEN